VTSSSSRGSRLRRSLRDEGRRSSSHTTDACTRSTTTSVVGEVIRPSALSPRLAWSAAAAAAREHRLSVDVDATAAMAASRQRTAAAAAAAGDGGTATGKVTAGGLSLCSTASNDTGYSSIGNSGERLGHAPGRVSNTGASVGDVAVSPASDCTGGRNADDDDVEQRRSVAELCQQFQTHSASHPTELSKRCVASSSPASGQHYKHSLVITLDNL